MHDYRNKTTLISIMNADVATQPPLKQYYARMSICIKQSQWNTIVSNRRYKIADNKFLTCFEPQLFYEHSHTITCGSYQLLSTKIYLLSV